MKTFAYATLAGIGLFGGSGCSSGLPDVGSADSAAADREREDSATADAREPADARTLMDGAREGKDSRAEDGSRVDSGRDSSAEDRATAESGRDSTTSDDGPTADSDDSSSDVGLRDADSSPPDSRPPDTGSPDGGSADSGSADSSDAAPGCEASCQTMINFDSLDASAAAVQGSAVSSYLAGYGVSVTADSDVGLNIQQAPSWEPTSSPPNFLNAFGSTATAETGVSYTLTLPGPMASVSFYRTGVQAGSTMGLWSATAYSASHQALSTVGESSIVTNVSPQQFVLSGPEIAYVTFSSNVEGVAGTYLSIDDLTLTP